MEKEFVILGKLSITQIHIRIWVFDISFRFSLTVITFVKRFDVFLTCPVYSLQIRILIFEKEKKTGSDNRNQSSSKLRVQAMCFMKTNNQS